MVVFQFLSPIAGINQITSRAEWYCWQNNNWVVAHVCFLFVPNISILKKQDSYKCTQCLVSGLKYMSSLCSISEIPWERWCVSGDRGSFGRVSGPEEHQAGVGGSAAENARGAMADPDRGHHHGLLPALWAECCKCPASGHGTSWGAPFPYNEVGITLFTNLCEFPLAVTLREQCVGRCRDLYCLGAFKTENVWGKPCLVNFEGIHGKVEKINKGRGCSFHFWYSVSEYAPCLFRVFSVDISTWIHSVQYLQRSSKFPIRDFKKLRCILDFFVASRFLSWKVKQKREKTSYSESYWSLICLRLMDIRSLLHLSEPEKVTGQFGLEDPPSGSRALSPCLEQE